jgi:tape measure domain-containing protein
MSENLNVKITLQAIDEASDDIKRVRNLAKQASKELEIQTAKERLANKELSLTSLETRNSIKALANEKSKLRLETMKAGKENKSFSDSIKSMTSVSSLAQIALGYLTISGVVSLTKSLIEAQIKSDNFERTLKVVAGSSQLAGMEMQFLKDQSNRLGLELLSVAGAYSRLSASTKASGMSMNETRELFLGVAEAGASLGLSGDQMDGVLVALQQISSKGKVSMEELHQIGERIPGAFAMASKAMGLTTKEFDKLVSSGGLMANDLLPKLGQEMRNTFGAGAVEGAQSLQGEMNRFNNAIFELKKVVLDGGFGDFLKGMFRESAGFLAQMNKDLQTQKNLMNDQGGTQNFSAQKDLAKNLQMLQALNQAYPTLEGRNREVLKQFSQLKKDIDIAMISGYSARFEKMAKDQQDNLIKSTSKNIEKLKKEEDAILNSKPTTPTGTTQKSEDKNANKYYEDELKKNILKSEEMQKNANRNKLAIQYEIDQMLIGAQEESLNRDIELARIKFQEKSDVLLNEKAVSGEYMNALTEQLQAEENSIKTKWAEEDRKLKEKQFADDKARAEAEARILYDKRMMHLSTANTIIGTMKLLSGTGKKYALLNKGLAMADIVVNTGRAVMQALTSPPGPPWTTGLAVATGAMGAVQFGKVAGAKFASKGADFITNGPQLMVVGENSGGREHVQVTPMSSPNINGPKSVSNNNSFGNINITVQNGGDLISMLESNPDRFNKLLKNGLKRGAFQGVM